MAFGGKVANHFVNRQYFTNRRNFVDDRYGPVVKIDIQLVPGNDENDVGDALLRFTHIGECFDAKFLGLIACRNQTSRIRQHRHHADRLSS